MWNINFGLCIDLFHRNLTKHRPTLIPLPFPPMFLTECSSPTLTFVGQFPSEPEVSTTVGVGYTLAQHEVSNVLSVKVNPSQTGLPVYIDAVLADGRLLIKTSAQFADYEKLDDKLFFFNRVVFTCTSGSVREMNFRQSIKEENNHAPLFSKTSYDITIPLPLPREFNIQQFIDGVRFFFTVSCKLSDGSLIVYVL